MGFAFLCFSYLYLNKYQTNFEFLKIFQKVGPIPTKGEVIQYMAGVMRKGAFGHVLKVLIHSSNRVCDAVVGVE